MQTLFFHYGYELSRIGNAGSTIILDGNCPGWESSRGYVHSGQCSGELYDHQLIIVKIMLVKQYIIRVSEKEVYCTKSL